MLPPWSSFIVHRWSWSRCWRAPSSKVSVLDFGGKKYKDMAGKDSKDMAGIWRGKIRRYGGKRSEDMAGKDPKIRREPFSDLSAPSTDRPHHPTPTQHAALPLPPTTEQIPPYHIPSRSCCINCPFIAIAYFLRPLHRSGPGVG